RKRTVRSPTRMVSSEGLTWRSKICCVMGPIGKRRLRLFASPPFSLPRSGCRRAQARAYRRKNPGAEAVRRKCNRDVEAFRTGDGLETRFRIQLPVSREAAFQPLLF